MKWLLIAVGLVVLLTGLVLLIGAALPLRHHATRQARLAVSPETLYAVIAGPPDWRSDVNNFGMLPDKDGRRQWWEEDSRGQRITYQLLEAVPAKRFVTRIADRNLPFGGTWSYDIAPAPGGGSELRISEDGEIYNVIFRFVSRFFLGYTATLERYLRDLGAKFDQTVEIEP
jgi:Polyketide cyclase / dehydrase and lipid transport